MWRTALAATGELVAWWVVLSALWLVFISSVDILEAVVGMSAAALGALAARAGRRAVGWR